MTELGFKHRVAKFQKLYLLLLLKRSESVRCYEMVGRVYLTLSGGVLADKISLGLRFAGLDVH